MDILWIVLYCIGGVFAFRWMAGFMMSDTIDGQISSDPAIIVMSVIAGLIAAPFWPAMLGFFIPYWITKLVKKTPLAKYIRWFFTLDRTQRKEIFS